MSEATLAIGDRVRVLATKGELTEGTKGTVIAVHDDGKTEVRMDGNFDDYLVEAGDLEIVRASTGAMEMTRMLYGIKYVRSGTPEELLEIEGHLNQMINEGMTYLFMEKFLMSYGYQPAMIRRAFQNLTGMTPQCVVNEEYIRSPGCIPQFTLGWGKGKSKKDGWYFVMPMVNWYALMHQVDDQIREEVSRHDELKDALSAMSKKVVKVEVWNPPVKDIKREDVDASQLYRQPQLWMNASYARMYQHLTNIHVPALRTGIITQAFKMGKLDKQSYDRLLQVFGDAEEDAGKEAIIDKLHDLEKVEMQKPLEDELAEKTPADFFRREELEGEYATLPADVVSAMSRYISNVGKRLRDFRISLRSFKYIPLHPSGRPNTESDEPDVLNAIVLVAVVLDIEDRTASSPDNKKSGGMVFSVIGNQLFTTDTIKGRDQIIYALSDEGLTKYFQKERSTK
jgi:hypothetical protein